MYLLDTDTIIYNLKGQSAVKLNLERHRQSVLKISIVTLMELYYGAYKSRKVTSNLAKVRNIEEAIEIVPIGRESAEVFAMLKANLEKSGTPLDDFDLLLASCAMAHDLVLVTNNTKLFERIEGLRLANWTHEAS